MSVAAYESDDAVQLIPDNEGDEEGEEEDDEVTSINNDNESWFVNYNALLIPCTSIFCSS